jgi:hypothetical protein
VLNHYLRYALLSMFAGILGTLIASLTSYWLYPLLRYDLSMYLRDLVSFGAAISAVFVWLVYFPAIAILHFLYSRYFAITRPTKTSIGAVLSLSFLTLFTSQIHPFDERVNWAFEYLLTVTLSALILFIVTLVFRRRSTS